MRNDDERFDAVPAAGLLRFEDSMRVVSEDVDDFAVLDAGAYVFENRELQNLVDEALRGRHAICGQSRNSVCYKIRRSAHGLSAADAVLKQAVVSNERTNPDSTFRREADYLKKLARLEIAGCPELLARFKYRGRYYLLLTFVPGEHPDPRHVPLHKPVLQQLFNAFSLMDQAGFIHYDLQAPNIVISCSKTGLIDFEFAGQCNPFSLKDESYVCDYNISSNPYVPLRSCVCNFEFRTLYPYLALMRASVPGRDVLTFVRSYLDCKADYHARMGQYFGSIAAECTVGAEHLLRDDLSMKMLRRGADCENGLAGLYRRPSPEVLVTESLILRLRFQLFERDFNNRRYDLTAGFTYAKAKVRRFARKAHCNSATSPAWYFENSLELMRKLQRKAEADKTRDGHC